MFLHFRRVEYRGSTLIFRQIEVEDAGKYECIAMNSIANASGIAEVIVSGKNFRLSWHIMLDHSIFTNKARRPITRIKAHPYYGNEFAHHDVRVALIDLIILVSHVIIICYAVERSRGKFRLCIELTTISVFNYRVNVYLMRMYTVHT